MKLPQSLLLLIALSGLPSACRVVEPTGLEGMYEASVRQLAKQDPRVGLDPKFLEAHAERIDQTRALVLAEKVESAEDYYFAASILVTSSDPTDLEMARVLGFHAADLGEPQGLYRAAEATDRLLLQQGMPQRFGTQIRYEPALAKFRLEPFEPATTDAERAKMNVPSMAQIQERLERMNGGAEQR